jgi:hypothetical protein
MSGTVPARICTARYLKEIALPNCLVMLFGTVEV